jgi:hypothetical protein
MRAPSVGLVLSAVKIRLFMWRTTVERPNSYGLRGPSQPHRQNIRDVPTFSTCSPATESRSDPGR